MNTQATNNKSYFGTDGIRGVANVRPLDPGTLVRLGKAIAEIFMCHKGRHTILIGKDTRLSGYMIENALAAGITSRGANVQFSGPIPTPGIAYLTRSMRVDAGIVVSASHNPFEDNGVKIFGSDGYKLADEMEIELESLIESDAAQELRAEPTSIGKAFRIDDAIGRYTVYLKSCFPRELSLEGLKIGFDCANGAGYIVGPQTCEELGAEVVSRGVSPNGRNINSGFGSLYPEIVAKLVAEHNLDIGISLDGDADRAVFIDEKGSVIDGDMVLALCAKFQNESGNLPHKKIVATVMSNLGLEKYLAREGIEVVRTQVGDRYVLEEMRKKGIALGGEQSGHTIFGDVSTTGDGILTSLKVLEVMLRKEMSLSELLADYIKFPQKLINVKVASKPDLSTVEEVSSIIKKKEKELEDRGRILVRYSGTENKVRVMVECEDEQHCKKHAADIAEVIEKAIGTV